jgi:hypothetical protein
MIQEWTANSQPKEVVLPDADILKAYSDFVGNDVKAKVHMLDVLDYWQNVGIGGHTIIGYAQLEPKNQIQTKDSVQLFGNCYIGLALPDFACPPERASNSTRGQIDKVLEIEWEVRTPPDPPNPDNGHSVPAIAYDERYLYVVTWGKLKRMSWQFYVTYMDEAYAVFSWEWIKANPPEGFDFSSLQSDLQRITGPARNDIKPHVLNVLNKTIPNNAPLPGNAERIPNTLSAEKWDLHTDCYLTDNAKIGLAEPLTSISTDKIYPHGRCITIQDAKGLTTVGNAIDLTWNRAKGQRH